MNKNRLQITRLAAVLLVLVLVSSLVPTSRTVVRAAPLKQTVSILLLTELVVTPTAGEFIEIHNPGSSSVDLSDVYVTDATFAPDGTFYYNIVTGANAGGGGFADFHARFPDGATIAPSEYQTIALSGSDDFFTEYGVDPTYELYEDGASPDGVPDMREAFPGSINGQGGLTNSGEVVILYQWDGSSDLVTDLDYALWGDKDEAVDKTGVSIDGPDPDDTPSTYLADTSIAVQDVLDSDAHAFGNSWQRKDLTEGNETKTGGNGADGHDETSEDVSNTWCEDVPTPNAISSCAPPPPPPVVTIMEIQGSGRFSPLAGEVVETSGTVTLFTASGSSCWLQDPDGDGDDATSDGIFVSGCAFADEGPVPAVGDFIRIIAQVEEQQFGTALPLTRLRSVALIEVLSSGNPLPAPVPLIDLPDVSIPEGELFWEPLEGMRVSVDNAPVVAATNGFGEFGMLTKDDAKPGSGFFADTQQILVNDQDGGTLDYNPERIMVDDSSLAEAIYVQPGDRVRGLVGVVDYTFSMYKLQPDTFDIEFHNLPKLPASTRSGGFGNASITTFNVENLFDLVLNTPQNVDVFGQVGFDPGSQWGPPNTQNNTLRRKAEVCQGDTDETDTFDPSLEWEGFGNDNFDDLGSHMVTCGPTDDLIISEYVEGSSLNKALEIYNGTGHAVNLTAEGYAIDIYFNGQPSPGTTIQLSGTLSDGDVFVVADDGANPAILAVADQTSSASFFNGDDTVILRKGGKDDASSTPTPEELEIKLNKLALAIEVELDLPEIIVVQEIENQTIGQELADLVNDATGTSYVATSFETSDARGIEVGFLWDASRVTLLDAFQMSGPDVEAWFGPTSPSPGREPLVGVFDIHGYQVTIIGNHFKSKGGDDPLYGVNWPPFRVTEIQRKGQARTVRNFVNTLLDGDPEALVMVAGDLNDFQFSEPGEGADYPIAILEGGPGEVPLTNLINLEKEAERYTYVFDGNSQVLDHMLVSPALYAYVVAADILHFNTTTPTLLLEDDASSPLSASDHDPLEGRFGFR
jgi:predicted extracellular nuclease